MHLRSRLLPLVPLLALVVGSGVGAATGKALGDHERARLTAASEAAAVAAYRTALVGPVGDINDLFATVEFATSQEYTARNDVVLHSGLSAELDKALARLAKLPVPVSMRSRAKALTAAATRLGVVFDLLTAAAEQSPGDQDNTGRFARAQIQASTDDDAWQVAIGRIFPVLSDAHTQDQGSLPVAAFVSAMDASCFRGNVKAYRLHFSWKNPLKGGDALADTDSAVITELIATEDRYHFEAQLRPLLVRARSFPKAVHDLLQALRIANPARIEAASERLDRALDDFELLSNEYDAVGITFCKRYFETDSGGKGSTT